MTQSKYTPDEYIRYLQISNNQHLLVEGSSDRKAFIALFYRFEINQDLVIDIDTGEMIHEVPDHPENRERIEYIAQKVRGQSCSNKLITFVDREFRRFVIETTIEDTLQGHYQQERLIWTRGHSLENYFLNRLIIKDIFEELSESEFFYKAIVEFENVFDDALKWSAAISLAAKELKMIQKCDKSFLDNRYWTLLHLCENEVKLDQQEWIEIVVREKKFKQPEVESLFFEIYKFVEIISSKQQIHKWICHGHLGIKFVWLVYLRCFFEQCPTDQFNKSLRKLTNYERRDHTLRTTWAKHSANEACVYPREVIEMLANQIDS